MSVCILNIYYLLINFCRTFLSLFQISFHSLLSCKSLDTTNQDKFVNEDAVENDYSDDRNDDEN